VRPLRRQDDPHGLVLHVPRLRDEHRLQLAVQRPPIFISLREKRQMRG
jgi:hypothetical protein